MSYILFATSTSGSGVQNPMTADLNANGFQITGAGALSGTVVIAGNEISHTNPAGTVGFYGVAPTPQGTVAHPIVGADPVQNETTINQICSVLQSLGLIA
jgi:hypothetical protein